MPTAFDEFVGRENLELEFKEFTFYNSDLILDNKLAEQYCYNKSFVFNNNVIKNLKRYFKHYLPKYTCAFFNSNIEGHLFFGVNNYGFTKGIPFQGELPIDEIKNKMLTIIKKRVKNDVIDFDFDKLIDIDIYKISNPPFPDLDIPLTFKKFLKKKNKFEKKYNKFIKKFNKWKIKMNFYTQKLVDLVNNSDSRLLLIEYIRIHESTSPIIALLESDFILQYNTQDEVAIYKDDKNNIYYWICKWKDEMIETMRISKPHFNDTNFVSCVPYNIIISASEMIPYWIHYNENMNLYIIYVKFNTLSSVHNITKINHYFEYKSIYDNNWISCYRNLLFNGEPTCTPL